MSLPESLSLAGRMVVALLFVGVVSLGILLTAAFVAGSVLFLAFALTMVMLGPVLSGTFLSGLWPPSTTEALVGIFGSGLLLLPVLYTETVKEEIHAFEAALGTTGTPAGERHPKIAGMARRLAQQANVPEPEVRIVNRSRPESYALTDGDGGTIVVTRGVIRQLDDAEIEAVLAHEVSHLANNDSRILRWLLVPMLVAEHLVSDDPPETLSGGAVGTGRHSYRHGTPLLAAVVHYVSWRFLRMVSFVQVMICQFGVAFLSRGRELAADTAAARLTGSPAALATALRKLDDVRSRPSEDKRDFMRTAGVLDILPVEDRHLIQGPFRTHPRTDARIARLERHVRETED